MMSIARLDVSHGKVNYCACDFLCNNDCHEPT